MLVNIGKNEFIVKTMISPSFTQMGMQGRKFDDTFNGMLFLMDDEDHSFWMKDCLEPLDIIFISRRKISKIYHNCQPCTEEPCKHYTGKGDLVLELPGGTCRKLNITTGDTLYF